MVKRKVRLNSKNTFRKEFLNQIFFIWELYTMRKGQEKLLTRAKKASFTEKQTAFLTNEAYTIKQLNIAFRYFQGQNKQNKLSDKDMIQEILRVFSMEHDKVPDQDFWRRVEYYLLPYTEDKIYGMSEKNEIANYHSSEVSVHFYCCLLYHISDQKIRDFLLEKQIQYMDDDEKKQYLLPEDIFIYCYLPYEEIIEDINQNKQDAVYIQILRKNLRIIRNNAEKINKLARYCLDKKIVANLEYMEPVIEKGILIDFNIDIIMYGKDKCLIRNNIWNLDTAFDDDVQQYEYYNSKIIEKWKSPDNINVFKNAVKRTKLNVYVVELLYRVTVSQMDSFININASVFNEVKLSYQGDSQSVSNFGSKILYTADYFITPDVRFFEKRNGKSYPLSINSVLFMMKMNPVFKTLVQHLIKILSNYNKFALDVLKDYREVFDWLTPMYINDIFLFHNKKEYFLSKYKTAQDLNIKWNKLNLNLSYMIMKSYPYVTEKSRNILIQIRNPLIIRNMKEIYNRKLKDKIVNFLSGIIIYRISEFSTQDDYEVIETGVLPEEQGENMRLAATDYVDMCMQRKIKVRLDIKTEKHLNKLHDAVNRADYDKETGKVEVPKKSRFYKLRAILPEEFEWIKTRKRLIMETKIQHHCVWKYADNITNDKSAIYSYVDYDGRFSEDGASKRYTIEFCMDEKGKYYVSQTQGRFDLVNSSKIQEYIETLLC